MITDGAECLFLYDTPISMSPMAPKDIASAKALAI